MWIKARICQYFLFDVIEYIKYADKRYMIIAYTRIYICPAIPPLSPSMGAVDANDWCIIHV